MMTSKSGFAKSLEEEVKNIGLVIELQFSLPGKPVEDAFESFRVGTREPAKLRLSMAEK